MNDSYWMTAILPVALVCASVAIVVFVSVCLPVLWQCRRMAGQMAQTLTELKGETSQLVQETRALVRNLDALTQRAHQQSAELTRVVETVRGWSDRVDRVVGELGAIVEPPLMAAARQVQMVRKGLGRFFETLLNRNQNNERKAEAEHVSQS